MTEFLAPFDLTGPSLIFPKLSKSTPLPVEWWNQRSRWPLARRHALLVKRQTCHYDDGNLRTGKLHCFCGEHKQGQEYGRIPRVMSIARATS